MNKQQEFERQVESLEIRTETSFSEIGYTKIDSEESMELIDLELSKNISDMIVDEKQKVGHEKIDRRFKKEEIKIKTRRVFSASNLPSQKRNFEIPKHIQRILDSSKKYPNVPKLQEKNQNQLNTIYGAFFGFLIGDVIGSNIAYNSNRNYEHLIPNALLMNGGGTYGLGAGQGSDQTEIMLSLCYALIEGQGTYNRNIVSKHYIEWFESKPFNFSAIFALSMREIRKKRLEGTEYDPKKLSKIILQSSEKNRNQESSTGFSRILPLALFGLKFNQTDFQRLIKDQLSLICPNQLVLETGIAYGKTLRNIFLRRDTSSAFFEASKWVYDYGSQKLLDLWKTIEKGVEIPSRGNIGKLKTAFTYAFIELNRPETNFIESLVRVLEKGGDTEITCSVVMTLVGASVGYSSIPGYFKQRIVNSSLKDSPRPRDEKYAPSQVFEVIEKIQKVQNQRLFTIY